MIHGRRLCGPALRTQTVFTEPSGSGTTDFKSVLSGNGRFVAFVSTFP